jgi:hypothetical protein
MLKNAKSVQKVCELRLSHSRTAAVCRPRLAVAAGFLKSQNHLRG